MIRWGFVVLALAGCSSDGGTERGSDGGPPPAGSGGATTVMEAGTGGRAPAPPDAMETGGSATVEDSGPGASPDAHEADSGHDGGDGAARTAMPSSCTEGAVPDSGAAKCGSNEYLWACRSPFPPSATGCTIVPFEWSSQTEFEWCCKVACVRDPAPAGGPCRGTYSQAWKCLGEEHPPGWNEGHCEGSSSSFCCLN